MRGCGECTLCCTVTRVPELDKQENVTCEHCDNGCSIYGKRPESCRTFKCQWLNGYLEENMRPDKAHFVIEKLLGVPVVLALFEPGYSITEEITDMLSFYKDSAISVVASNGQALIPDGVTPETVRKYVIDSAKTLGVIQ